MSEGHLKEQVRPEVGSAFWLFCRLRFVCPQTLAHQTGSVGREKNLLSDLFRFNSTTIESRCVFFMKPAALLTFQPPLLKDTFVSHASVLLELKRKYVVWL